MESLLLIAIILGPGLALGLACDLLCLLYQIVKCLIPKSNRSRTNRLPLTGNYDQIQDDEYSYADDSTDRGYSSDDFFDDMCFMTILDEEGEL